MKIKILNAQTQVEIKEINLAEAIAVRGDCLLGRSPNSGLVLESSDVSRLHGKFSLEEGDYYFCDLGSANGSLVNGKIALANNQYLLKTGDIIRIGEFVLMLQEINPYPDSAVMPATVIGDPNATVMGGWQFDSIHTPDVPSYSEAAAAAAETPLPVPASATGAEPISMITSNEITLEEIEEAPVADAIAPEADDEESVTNPLWSDTAPASPEQAEAAGIPISLTSNQAPSQADLIPEPDQTLPLESSERTDQPLEPVILADRTVIQSAERDQSLDSAQKSDTFSDSTVIQPSDLTDEDEDQRVEDSTESLMEIDSHTIQAIEPEPIDASAESSTLPDNAASSDSTVIQPSDLFDLEVEDADWIAEPVSEDEETVQLTEQADDRLAETDEALSAEEELEVSQADGELDAETDEALSAEEELEVSQADGELDAETDSTTDSTTNSTLGDTSADAPTEVELSSEGLSSEGLDELASIDSVSEISPSELEDSLEEADVWETELATELETLPAIEISEAIAEPDFMHPDETIKDVWAEPEASEPEAKQVDDVVAIPDSPTFIPTAPAVIKAIDQPIDPQDDQGGEPDQTKPELDDEVLPQTPEPLDALPQILREKYIALLAHESHQSDLVQFVAQHQALLSQCLTVATPAISEMIAQQAGFQVTQQTPAMPPGGYQTVNSLITSGKILAVIFLRDFFTPQATQANDEALSRSCNIYEVLFANNLPTSEAIVHYIQTAIKKMS